jgi:phosphonate transport system substrate-binding protein
MNPTHLNPTDHLRSFRKAQGIGLWLILLVATTGGWAKGQGVSPPAPVFHIAFSSGMFTDINVNDAKAALKAWLVNVALERHMNTDPEPWIVDGILALAALLRSNRVDAIELPVADYVTLSKEAKFDPLFVASTGGRIAEEYVVLVHRDSRIETLADLRGRHLNLYSHYRACLAQPWLDTLLVQQGLPPAAEFFREVAPNSKLTKVVLPVFFRQVDACLVTRSGFEIMNELNPQTGKQLKIIATSPGIVPAVFCFRADIPAEIKEPYVKGLRELHQHAAGQQVLTIFHREKLEEHPASCLQSALDLVETYHRLCRGTNDAQLGHEQLSLRQSGNEGAAK